MTKMLSCKMCFFYKQLSIYTGKAMYIFGERLLLSEHGTESHVSQGMLFSLYNAD